jgi:hypothetical protein
LKEKNWWASFVMAGLLVVVAFALSTSATSMTAQDDGQPSHEPVAFEWQKSNIHLLISDAFESAGHPKHEASELATQAIEELRILSPAEERAGADPPDVIFEWRKSNLHLILADAFVSAGYPEREAVELATHAIVQIMGITPGEGEMQPLGEDCWVYPVRVIYCDGGQKKSVRKYLSGLCWEDLGSACLLPVCDTGEIPWFTLTKSSTCDEPDPPAGTCVWIGATGDGKWVPCDWLDYDCDCFDEADPIDCGEIEIECGDEFDGPSGCPQC